MIINAEKPILVKGFLMIMQKLLIKEREELIIWGQ